MGDPFELGLWLILLGIPCSRSLVEIGATLLIASWAWQKIRAGDLTLRRSLLIGPVTAFVLWSALSLLWTHHPHLSARSLVSRTLEYAAIYLAVSDWLRDGRKARRLLWGWLICGGLMVLDGAAQLAWGKDLIRGYAPGLIAGGARMTAAMKYPNDFGAYLALTGMLGMGIAIAEWSEGRRRRALAASAVVLLTIVGLIATFSRGAWLGLAVAVLVASLLYRTRMAIPCLVGAGLAVALLPPIYLDRLTSILSIHPGSASEERLLIWESALRMIKEHPWLGFGLNTYNATFPTFKSPEIWGTPYAHNCYLQLTVELGLIGLALFTWLLLAILKQGWRPHLRPGWERAASLSLVAAVAGYMTQSATDTNWYSLPLAVMWWLAIGHIDALGNIAEDRSRLMTQQIRHLVAIRTDRLGDVLMNLPAINALRRRFSHATITLVVREPLSDLLRGQPGIHDVQPAPPAWFTGWLGTVRMAWRLRQGRYDAAVILNPTRAAHIASFLAGIPIRVGYARKWDFLLTDTLPDRKQETARHEVEYNLELVALLGAAPRADELHPTLTVPPHDREQVHRLLRDVGLTHQKPIVAIHPWTSDPVKQWPLTSMAELIEILGRDERLELVLIGGAEEEEHARHFLAGLRTPIASFVGRLSLKQLAALLRTCQTLVSNDSGPVHVAAAVGTPTVTLFTGRRPAATPLRWGPRGAGHVILAGPHPEMPISVEEVIAAVHRQVMQPKVRQ